MPHYWGPPMSPFSALAFQVNLGYNLFDPRDHPTSKKSCISRASKVPSEAGRREGRGIWSGEGKEEIVICVRPCSTYTMLCAIL